MSASDNKPPATGKQTGARERERIGKPGTRRHFYAWELPGETVDRIVDADTKPLPD
ncbi:MAG: hypothetical protein VX836_02815 [Pseudomonadota bacterium]|nr:hypothetical protein [Pseudomonadota bacterium]